MRHDIIIAGVGGQGILTIARVLSMAALAKGVNVKLMQAGIICGQPGIKLRRLSLPLYCASKNKKAHEPKFVGFPAYLGRPCGARTCDQRIKSPLLYQLS